MRLSRWALQDKVDSPSTREMWFELITGRLKHLRKVSNSLLFPITSLLVVYRLTALGFPSWNRPDPIADQLASAGATLPPICVRVLRGPHPGCLWAIPGTAGNKWRKIFLYRFKRKQSSGRPCFSLPPGSARTGVYLVDHHSYIFPKVACLFSFLSFSIFHWKMSIVSNNSIAKPTKPTLYPAELE